MADYPTEVASFPARANGNAIPPTDHNLPCDEIVAIENALLGGFAHWLKSHGITIGAADPQTIASGEITITKSNVVVDTQGASAADDLDTINVGVPTNGPTIGEGSICVLSAASAARVVTVKNGSNITLTGGDCKLTSTASRLVLIYNGSTTWVELFRTEEVGTWTPVIGGTGGTSGQTYSAQKGWYVKVGRLVTAGCYVALTGKGTITTSVQIEGLPYTVDNVSGQFAPAAVPFFDNLNTAGGVAGMGGYGVPNTTTVLLKKTAAAGAAGVVSLTTTDIGNTTEFMMSIQYLADL